MIKYLFFFAALGQWQLAECHNPLPWMDTLRVAAGPGVSALRDFYVFNRWGAVVFKAVEVVPNAPETAWDGFFRGKACDPGSYAYRVSATFTDGQTEVFSGDITLVR